LVIICEGASEVGLVRGIDQHRSSNGAESVSALGTAVIDCGGGDSDRPFTRAAAFQSLGYKAAVLRDDDKQPTQAVEAAFIANGGEVIAWRAGRALEDELFLSLSDDGVVKLIDRAIQIHGEELINEHIKSASTNAKDLNAIQTESLFDGVSAESRTILGKAARTKRAGWFKSVTWMEDVARDIIGPDLPKSEPGFRELVESVFAWAHDAEG